MSTVEMKVSANISAIGSDQEDFQEKVRDKLNRQQKATLWWSNSRPRSSTKYSATSYSLRDMEVAEMQGQHR